MGQYKQKNIILFFPMYICLGVYYVLYALASPFMAVWNSFGNKVYKTVSPNGNNDLRGAYMSGTEADAKAPVPAAAPKKEYQIPEKLLNERKALIDYIEANADVRSDHPITYRYTALGLDGEKVTNTFWAYSKIEVYTFLENEGYKVFSIETSPMIETLYGPKSLLSRKIKTKDIVFWLQQMSTYLKAGIPLTDSMRILSKQMGKKDKNIKRIFDSIIYYLTLGENFSDALEKQGDCFPALLINMIKSAEATGDMEGTLDEMAEYYKSTETIRKELISALTYPILVAVFSIVVVIFILVYVVPQFVSIYEQAAVTLNPITAFLIEVSNFCSDNLLIMGIFLAVIIIVIVIMYKNIKGFRYALQVFAMKMPVFGNMIIYKEMMIFTKTFSSLLRNNVFITESMDILRKVTSNELYREIMINTINYISRGEKISASFKDQWAVPEVAYYMMVTGESTGELAEMLGKVSDYYAEQHKMLVDSAKTLIEPILIVFLAVVVGGIMIAVIVPMFSLYSQIQ